MRAKDFVTEDSEQYSGVIQGIKYVLTGALTPHEDLRVQWKTIREVMKDDGKTKEEWASWWMKGQENNPAEVHWWGNHGWELLLVDGHHRYIAAQILNIPLRVDIDAFNVPYDYIDRFIVANNEELRQYGRKYMI